MAFSKLDHEQCDKSAKDKLKKLFSESNVYSKFTLVEPSDPYTVDFYVYNGDNHVANVEVEVKRLWNSYNFPFDDIQILPRKRKFWENEIHSKGKPTMFVMFNEELDNHLVISDAMMKELFESENQSRSYASDRSRQEEFLVINRECVEFGKFFNDVPIGSQSNIKSFEETTCELLSDKELPMYTHVFHNRSNDKLYIWYTDGSCKEYSTKHRFYTPVKGYMGSIDCGMKDIYGNPVYVAYTDNNGERQLKDQHYGPDNRLHEIDVDYRTRQLQEHYSNQEDINISISDFNVCYIDIEVESGKGFPNPEDAEYAVNVVTIYFTKYDAYITFGLGQDISDRTIERLQTMNQYRFGTGLLFENDEVDSTILLNIFRENNLINKFKLPKEDDVDEFDLVKILNGILNSNANRDKFFSECIKQSIDTSWHPTLGKYLSKFKRHEENKAILESRIKDKKQEIKTSSVKERRSIRREITNMTNKFNEWVSTNEISLKDERVQKKLIRSVMEYMLPVVKGQYPSDSSYKYVRCNTERDLIGKLFSTISDSNVDILSGWNSAGFDWPYLFKRSKTTGVKTEWLVRKGAEALANKVYLNPRSKEYKNTTYYDLQIPGTTQYDYMLLYKMFSRSERDDYKLDTIAKAELGDEKKPMSNGYHTYRTNWDEYVEYNVQDVKLLADMDKQLKLMETSIGVCSQARIPLDGLYESKKIIVGFLLTYLHNKKMVMPPLREHPQVKFPGAFVFSKPNRYRMLVSFDYRSMYPSIDMAGNISIETKVTFPEGYEPTKEELENLVISPVPGVYFRKDKVGIIPSVMKTLFDGRSEIKLKMKEAKKEGRLAEASFLDMKQNAYKIFGNSLYGLLGLRYFQFYDLDCAHSITAFGVDLIRYTILRVSDYFDNQLINDDRFVDAFGSKPNINPTYKKYDRFSHGDTDSFFIKFDDIYAPYENKYSLTEFCRIFDKAILDELLAEIMQDFSDKWNCKENTFFLKREKCINGALVVAKKKYICSVESNEDYIYPELTPAITGMEIVRSSTAPFSRERLQDLAWAMVNGASKSKCAEMYRDAKHDFYLSIENGDIYPISSPSGIGKTPPDVKTAMTEKGSATYLGYSGAVWNDLLENDKVMSEEMHEPIAKSSKIKLLKVNPRNRWRTNYIAYVGNECPDRILEIFDVDWEAQFTKIYGKTAGGLFKVAGWPENLMEDKTDLLEMF